MALQRLFSLQLDKSKLTDDELIDLKISEQVKKHSCLWNIDQEDRHKTTFRHCWNLVAQSCHVKVDVCRERWKKMRDRLRHKVKHAFQRSDDGYEAILASWDFLPALTFMINGKQINRWAFSDNNHQIENEYRQMGYPELVITDCSKHNKDESSEGQAQNGMERRSIKRKMSTNKTVIQEETALAKQQKTLETEIDEDYLFLMSLLPTFKHFEEIPKMKLKIKIQKLFYEELADAETGNND